MAAPASFLSAVADVANTFSDSSSLRTTKGTMRLGGRAAQAIAARAVGVGGESSENLD